MERERERGLVGWSGMHWEGGLVMRKVNASIARTSFLIRMRQTQRHTTQKSITAKRDCKSQEVRRVEKVRETGRQRTRPSTRIILSNQDSERGVERVWLQSGLQQSEGWGYRRPHTTHTLSVLYYCLGEGFLLTCRQKIKNAKRTPNP